ncbi:MAG: BamA/TamA family outer membrane protein [Planctomycetota bacterium]
MEKRGRPPAAPGLPAFRAAAAVLALLAGGVLGGALAAQAGPGGTIEQSAGEERPVVHRIAIAGPHRADEAQLLRALGQEVGRPIDPPAIDRGIERLWELHHLHSAVYKRPLEVDGVPGLELLLVTRELPLDLEPRFLGNVKIDLEELYKWTGLQPGQELHLDEADRVRERLLRAYRNEGYYFAEVRAVERVPSVDEASEAEIAPDVILEIREGPKVRVRDVVIEGNRSISNRSFLFFRRGLSKLAGMKLRGPRFFGLFKKAFVEETLEADLIGLRTVYRDQGWLNAVIDVSQLEFSPDRRWVTIHVLVDEGERFTIGSIAIEGVERVHDGETWEERPAELFFPAEELQALLKTKPDDFYEQTGVQADQAALRRFYGEHGHIQHESLGSADRWEFLEPEIVLAEDRPVVHVVYRLAQGRPIFLREIRIAGNLHTQDRVVRRAISVEEGVLADPSEIERSRNRIEALGYFSNPMDPLAHREPTYRFEATSDPNWKDLVFEIEEGQVIRFNISGGVSSSTGAFGLISYTQQNFDITNLPRSFGSLIGDVASREAFHGAGQSITLQASPGTEVSYFDISFTEPDLFGRHQDRISGSVLARRRRQLFRSHGEERSEVGFQLGRQVTIDSSIYAGYSYETVEISDLDHAGEPTLGSPLNVPTLLKDQEGESNLGYVEFGYRLSTVDNRLDPHNGVRVHWMNQLHNEKLGGDHEFVKSDLRLDYYDEIGPEEEEQEEAADRWHVGMRAAVATGYGDTDDVPYSERFFGGGSSYWRGWRYRGVGPNEKGYPLGGETMLFATVDYRWPLVTTTQPGTYREIETFNIGVFVDAGVLDPDAFSLDFDELRASVGVAFGITVPIPIVFSYGVPIEKGAGDDTQRFAFDIGF